MRALSIRQSWAWAIIHAGKDVENRTWSTRLRGTIAVHASGNPDQRAELPEGSKKPKDEELVRGAIIGVVDIVDVVRESSSKWFVGPYGFVLENPRPLPRPIPCKGALGFWRAPPDVQQEIEFQLASRRTRCLSSVGSLNPPICTSKLPYPLPPSRVDGRCIDEDARC